MGAANRSRFLTKGRREAEAGELLGVHLARIPKSALAVVAYYLALAIDEGAGEKGARDRFWHEWEVLHAQGIVEQAPPKRPGVRAAILKAEGRQ